MRLNTRRKDLHSQSLGKHYYLNNTTSAFGINIQLFLCISMHGRQSSCKPRVSFFAMCAPLIIPHFLETADINYIQQTLEGKNRQYNEMRVKKRHKKRHKKDTVRLAIKGNYSTKQASMTTGG